MVLIPLGLKFQKGVFHLCKLGTKQNHICTKGSYLVITLHGFCAGQNHKVMCKAKELGMNFFHNQVFFLSMSSKCASRASLTGVFGMVTAPAYGY